IDKLDKDKARGWNEQLKKPNQTYQDEIDALKKQLADQSKSATDSKEEARKANELAAATQRELEAAKADYLNKLAERQKQDAADLQGLRDQVVALQKQLDQKGEVALKELDPLKKENNQLRSDNKKIGKGLADAIKTIKDRGWEQARAQANEEFDVSKMAPE